MLLDVVDVVGCFLMLLDVVGCFFDIVGCC